MRVSPGATVAKKRSRKSEATEPKDAAVRDPDTWHAKPIIVSIRGTQQSKEWLEDFAAANGQSVAGLIRMALAVLARQTSFREPPEW